MPDSFGPGFVVMAVYRPDPHLFSGQIRSLRHQTVRDWRCLVGIDGADPGTVDLAERLVERDPRFAIVEYADNVGVYRHFERLLERVPSDARWVSLADQDDHWYPDKFARILPVLAQEGVTAVVGQARLTDRDGSAVGYTQRLAGSQADILLRNQVSGALTVFRRNILDLAFPFPEPTAIAIHDHWLGVVAAGAGRVEVLDEPVQDYVQHGGNVLGEPRQPSVRESWSGVRAVGGLSPHLDRMVNHRWGWRVAMARRALDMPDLPDRHLIADVARGRLTARIVRLIVHALRSTRITARDAVGLSAAPLLWPVLGGSPISRRPSRPFEPIRTAGIVVPIFEPDDGVVNRVAQMAKQAHVVCVDDGSPSGAEEVLSRLKGLSNVTVLRSAHNRGIASALNLGVERLLAGGVDAVVTFDQDSEPSSNHVAGLMARLEANPAVGVIGPGRVDGVPVRPRVSRSRQPVAVHSMIQSGMVIRSSVLSRVGLFDEALFIDGVDTDFCLRVSQSGAEVVVEPALDMRHGLGGHTGMVRRFQIGPFRPVASQHSSRRRYFINRNAVALVRRHGTARPGWAFATARHLLAANALSLTLEPDRRDKARSILSGLRDGIRGVSGARPR